MRRKLRTTPTIQQQSYQSYQSKTTNSTRLKWIVLLSLVILLLVFINSSYVSTPSPERKAIESNVTQSNFSLWYDDFRKNLSKHTIPSQWITGMNQMDKFIKSDEPSILLRISFPKQFAIHPFISSIAKVADKNYLQLIESYERLTPCSMTMILTGSNKKMIQIEFKENPDLIWYSGKMAIVIDDFGYKRDIQHFLNIPFPITFAIIPGTEFAEQIAKRVHQAGFDILIHLPMEPLQSKVENNGYTIFTNMSEQQIEEVVIRSMNLIPNAIGVNNHMGSKATTNRMTMARLMRVLKKYNLLFLDSVTNRRSVAFPLANQTGISALKMTTYLDNPKNSRTVGQKLEGVVKRLTIQPNPIVIGHNRIETAQILVREMPRYAYLGVTFVRLNELLEKL